MSSTEIEKKSLEAHVELCAERYANLDNKLSNLETRMDKLEGHIVDIKDSLSGNDSGHYKTLITVGTTILGVLIAGLITVIVNLVK
jgi:hypothetical protein|tara:strand:- start:1472 stop:1729 length:258 start_codon:yes stop_codon:yes gene_type:complete